VGEVPDWDNTESRESDEDAAWRDLVARFEAPAISGQPAPWPEREDTGPARETRGSRGVEGTEGARGGTNGAHAAEGKHRVEEASGANGADGVQEVDPPESAGGSRAAGTAGPRRDDGNGDPHGGAGGTAGPRGNDGIGDRDGADEVWGMHGGEGIWVHEPNGIWAPERAWRGSARGMPKDDPDDEHFVPPTPPPLPRLDPVTKGAWAALFGGPGYLVLATAAGWSIPALAAFCAVAAFVAGFAVLVLRMHGPESEGPGGPDDNDNGAVV
jgi:hypothetical protein